jgi:hypothetical protein
VPDIRPLNTKKYEISKHKFLYVYHFCMQYNEWQTELKYMTNTVKSLEITDMPVTHENSDSTSRLAVRRAELERKCKLIEQTAIEADAGIYQYILKAVTNEGFTYNYLREVMDIPVSHNTFYNRRRKFYWLMAEKI